ncbi:ABC transporter ATP-binding protein [Microbacterium sp. Leaf320]|uniref:ABC transporter ATP-binding protein n=1 Tax=Microbacterium sp. Leaf320 TaxID=1736334 RepID=UPI0006FA3F1D|nr:ABC transporter ATP-binding protein [Microbacterium sp. Leaf320]KQQ65442.1 ABC transporter ATP-binding protein [Microbacterium sp. Leaf320]
MTSFSSPLSSAPAVRLSQVTRTYGRGDRAFTAVNDISLDVQQGQSLAVVGKSGSGKSTLMHLMALLDTPTTGEVDVLGTPSARLRPREKNLIRNRPFGFVFQQFFLNGSQSVFENVSLPLVIAGVPARQRRAKVMAALESMGLEGKARNAASDLSGGQKQRVVIARALVNDPAVIFADEPTGNLDSATGAHVEDLLFDLQRRRGITLVIVTHDPDLAGRCDERVTIADGRVAMEGARAA